MNLTPSLHKSLLAGTSRVTLDAAASGAPELQALLEGAGSDAALWHAIAAADLWQRAGCLPAAAAPASPACTNEATCTRAAESVLHLILRGIHPELLDSWLALARRHAMRLPHSALVPMLDMGAKNASVRQAMDGLLGGRGAWLAAQHPEWHAVYGAALDTSDTKAQWELGTLPQRVAALRAMRAHDPQAARASLQAEWPQATPEQRAALLECLLVRLSLADEPFLEAALDNKRKEVRTAAQQLLASLPCSQLRARCQARLDAAFQLERKMLGLRLPQLHVTLPEACDKSMKRDGIGSSSHPGLGEKAGWLLDLMRCVPPTHWSGSWQLEPRDVIKVMAAQEFKTALLSGLLVAGGRAVAAGADAQAIAWFGVLADETGRHDRSLHVQSVMLPFMAALPAVEQERIVRAWLANLDSDQHALWSTLSWAAERSADTPLPSDMARQILAALQQEMRARPQHAYMLTSHLRLLARVMDPADAVQAAQGWPADDWEHWPAWRAVVDQLTDTLQFRHTMQASFLETDA